MNTDQPDPTSEVAHARGAVTLLDVLRASEARGFTTTMRLDDDGALVCGQCDQHSAAGSVDLERHERLEGASDAADLMFVGLVRCPHCAARGSLVLGYGPNASAADVAFLSALDLGSSPSQTITEPGPPDDRT